MDYTSLCDEDDIIGVIIKKKWCRITDWPFNISSQVVQCVVSIATQLKQHKGPLNWNLCIVQLKLHLYSTSYFSSLNQLLQYSTASFYFILCKASKVHWGLILVIYNHSHVIIAHTLTPTPTKNHLVRTCSFTFNARYSWG